VKRGGVDQMFRAFSDRTRLRILHLLKDHGEFCVETCGEPGSCPK
jgi:DNA-binding transcriptional ArsR family regulator